MTAPPLGYLATAGANANTITPLLWYTLDISVAVTVVITIVLVMALLRRPPAPADAAEVPVRRSAGALRPIMIALAISVALLLSSLGWTLGALAQISRHPRRPEIEIDVTAHQWWWEASYAAVPEAQGFVTANEIHVPVGANVLLRLHGGDVIHSFWVPQLTGKTDVIPGQVNQTWLAADHPGRFLGQCSEYCGVQHAHMQFAVVADPPAQFEAWRRAQLQTAPPPATPAQAEGLALFQYRCALCHALRGTTAGSHVGPDLSHLLSRRAIAAGTLPNNSAALAGWIEDPQGIKPGARMPPQQLAGPQFQSLLAYLETLK